MASPVPSDMTELCERGNTVSMTPVGRRYNVLCNRLLSRGMCRLTSGDIMGPLCPHAMEGLPLGGKSVGPRDFLLNRPVMILSNPKHKNYGLTLGYQLEPLSDHLDPGYRLVGFDKNEWLGHLGNPNIFTLSLTSSGELIFVGGEVFPFSGTGADLMDASKCQEMGIPHVLMEDEVEQLTVLARRQIQQRKLTDTTQQGELLPLEE